MPQAQSPFERPKPIEADGLFDDAGTWSTYPVIAFEGLLTSPQFVALGRRDLNGRNPGDAHRSLAAASASANLAASDAPARISAKSAQVYLTMFRSYVHFLESKQLTVPQAKPEHIIHFIEAKERTTGVRQRYLRMLERVYEHMRMRQIVNTNPASLAIPSLLTKDSPSKLKELPTLAVDKAAQPALAESVLRSMLHNDDWRNVRDAAMAAILVGAGLKVFELTAMRTNWLAGSHPDYAIDIPAVGTSRPHRVPLPLLAADCVKAWLDCRSRMGFVQPLMFVNSQAEGRLPYVPNISTAGGAKQSVGLDKSTVYRRMKALLKQAGVETPRMGGRILRNTYAVTELTKGQSTALLEERMGLRESKSLNRYIVAAKIKNP